MATYVPATGDYVTFTSTTPATNSMVWGQWVNAGHTTWSSTTNVTWNQWVQVYADNRTVYRWQDEVWGQWEADERTEEERRQARDELQARREQHSRERLAAEQERMENQLVAHARALELLDMITSEEERAERLEHGKIAIKGSDGHFYWLETDRQTVHGNIVRTDKHGCHLGRACVAPRMSGRGEGVMPLPDGWVGQYLGLKFDTEAFLSHANWSSVRPCTHPAEVAA